jgi:hypothetical protein
MKRFSLLAAVGAAGAALAVLVLGSTASARTAQTTTAATTTAATATAPKNTAPPTISGKAQVGQLLTADPGKWSGTTPLSFSYQWRICGTDGGACRDIPGATGKEYYIKSQDLGNTIRVQVTAKNSAGSSTATSVPSALIAAAPGPAPAPTGCPKAAAGATSASIADISLPARLLIDQVQSFPNLITRSTHSITVKVHVSSTCGTAIQGANVFLTGVPYNMISIGQATSDANGWATMQVNTQRGFPATPSQQLMVMFVRATKAGENQLAGVSTRRLVSFRVILHG